MDKNTWINRIRKAKSVDKFDYIVDYCKNKHVLDVGCIGQDKTIESDTWLHGRIKKVASKLIGADIIESEITRLKQLGFNIMKPEELSEANEKFDLIIMGDVIEHVNDPGQFLAFYAQFLKDNGEMIICTPNSFGIRYILQVFFYGKPSTNEEHTMAFDPYVMLELFQRIGLKPSSFLWLKEYHKGRNIQQKIILFLSSIAIFLRKYYQPNFMYIIKKDD